MPTYEHRIIPPFIIINKRTLSTAGEEELILYTEKTDQYKGGKIVLDVIEVIHFYTIPAKGPNYCYLSTWQRKYIYIFKHKLY